MPEPSELTKYKLDRLEERISEIEKAQKNWLMWGFTVAGAMVVGLAGFAWTLISDRMGLPK